MVLNYFHDRPARCWSVLLAGSILLAAAQGGCPAADRNDIIIPAGEGGVLESGTATRSDAHTCLFDPCKDDDCSELPLAHLPISWVGSSRMVVHSAATQGSSAYVLAWDVGTQAEGAIWRVSLCDGRIFRIGSSTSMLMQIVAGRKAVYWSELGHTIGGDYKRDGIIWTASLDCTDSSQKYAHLNAPEAMAVGGDSVFWGTADGRIEAASPTDTAPSLIGEGYGREIDNLAVDESNIYWHSAIMDQVYRVPRSGGKPVLVTTGKLLKNTLLVDADWIYWAENQTADDGGHKTMVMRAPKRGDGTPLPFGDLGAQALAQDAERLYVVAGGGDVLAINKKSGESRFIGFSSNRGYVAASETAVVWVGQPTVSMLARGKD